MNELKPNPETQNLFKAAEVIVSIRTADQTICAAIRGMRQTGFSELDVFRKFVEASNEVEKLSAHVTLCPASSEAIQAQKDQGLDPRPTTEKQ